MADDNKIQFDVELNEGSVESSFKKVDERAVKSAKESAAVFGEAFQRQEQELQASIERIVGNTKKVATKSAKESAEVFGEMFKKQDDIYKASVKNSLDQAISKIMGGDSIKKSAQESASVFEEAFSKGLLKDGSESIWDGLIPQNSVRGLADIAGGFFLLQQAASAAGAAIQTGLDFIINGEREIKLDRRFSALAQEAGVAADVIKNELKTATAGLIDETKLLEVGSQAFIQLGANAKALPQILELARKTYVAFGGDIVENTEKITSAIFSGQTRQLRGLGILIDTDKVYKDYARTLGTVPQLLSESQKQQALLNAVLEQGKERFKNIKVESDGAEGSFQRLKTATKDLFDALSVKTAQQSSGFFAFLSNAATSAVSAMTNAINKSPVDKAKERIKELEDQLKSAQKVVADFTEGKLSYTAYGRGSETFFAKAKLQVENLTKEIEKNKSVIAQAVKAQEDLTKSRGPSGSAGGTASGSSEEEIKRREALSMKIQEINNQLRQSEVQLAQEEFSRKQNSVNLDALYYQQKLQAADAYNQQKSQLEKFYIENGIIDETMRQQGRELLEQAHLNRMLQLQMQYTEQKKQVYYEGETAALSAGEAFTAVMEGMDAQAKDFSVNASKNFKNLGRQMQSTFANAAANAFAAFGQAIAEGDNALEAFGKSLLNSLGQAAIQMGSLFILQGIAYTYAGLANGPPLIAAGAALAVAGGVLSVIGGTGPRDVSGGGGTAGGGIGQTSDMNDPINDVIAPEDTEPQTPQTAVNLTINGNVFDRRETGLEIAKILEEQFADQGLVIRGA